MNGLFEDDKNTTSKLNKDKNRKLFTYNRLRIRYHKIEIIFRFLK